MSIRLLFLTAETYPTFRVDVNVLFGKVLPRYGIKSDHCNRKKHPEKRMLKPGEAARPTYVRYPPVHQRSTFANVPAWYKILGQSKYRTIPSDSSPRYATTGDIWV